MAGNESFDGRMTACEKADSGQHNTQPNKGVVKVGGGGSGNGNSDGSSNDGDHIGSKDNSGNSNDNEDDDNNDDDKNDDNDCWVKRRYCLAGITKLGERVAKNTKLE